MKEKITLIIFFLILLFPSSNSTILNGLPFDNLPELIFILGSSLLLNYSFSKGRKKRITPSVTVLVIIKLILFVLPSQSINLCYSDELVPRTTQFDYIEIDRVCEHTFSTLKKDISDSVYVLDFSYLDNDLTHRGSNNSKFNLSFHNMSKFNFHIPGSPNREWLPFQLKFSFTPNEDSKFIRFEFIGDVFINNLQLNSYDVINVYDLKIDKNNEIDVIYTFSPDPLVLNFEDPYKNTLIKNYAFLKIYESSDGEVFNLINKKSPIKTIVAYGGILIFFMTLITKEVILEFFNIFKLNLISFFLIIILIFNLFFQFSKSIFPTLGFFNLETLFLLIIFSYLMVANKNSKILCFVNLCLLNLLLVDQELINIDNYIRPGGSDALTYESQSRLLLIHNFFQGGENIYHYSPGMRYILMLSHIILGDRYQNIFILVISLTIFMGIRLILEKTKKGAKFQFLYLFLFLTYLTSNAVQRIFYYGMSESFGLLTLLTGLYFIKVYNKKILYVLFVSLSVVIRPVFMLGVLVLNFKTRLNKKELILFFVVVLLPAIHNIFYGNSLVLFTKTISSSLNIFDQNKSFMNTLFDNLLYIVMYPMNSDIQSRVGRLIPYIIFLVFIGYLIVIIFNRNKTFTNTVIVFSFALPFLIYSPVHFYPRFVLVFHTLLLLDFILKFDSLKFSKKIFSK